MAAPIFELVYAFYFILPAYAANAIPVILGGGLPIDLGRKLPDGRPVFGSHKTIRGFISGMMAGTLISTVQTVAIQHSGLPHTVLPYQFNILVGFVLSLGALTGDLVHSFIKRRLGIGEGDPLPVADQLDFVLGALLFSLTVSSPSLLTVGIVLLVTPPIHLLTNFLAYILGMKRTPL